MRDTNKIVVQMKHIYQRFCKIEVVVCAIFFVIIISLVFLAAILRKISMPIQWSSDVSQLLFAWLAFLGADVALRKGSLVGVALLTEHLPIKLQHVFQLLCYGFMLVFLTIVVKYGFPLAIRNWHRAFQTLPISYAWVTLSLPVSAIFMVFSIIHNIILGYKPSISNCSCAITKEA